MSRVPLARRNLFQDRRRSILSISGIAAALLLVLVLNGIFDGAIRQVTAYMRNSPADVFVSQEGVRTMHMSVSSLPPETIADVQDVEGVAWAEGLHYTSSTLTSGDDQRLTYVFGYDTTSGRSGPRGFAAGGAPGAGEAVVDEVAAEELDIGVGDDVRIMGEPFEVSGLSTDGTNIVNTTVYVRAEDFEEVRGPSLAYVLVGAHEDTDVAELVDRLSAEIPGTTAQTRDEFARQEGRIVRDMAADVMRIMSTIGFLIALAVVALTLFTATLARLREYGVVKAIGARSTRLAGTVAAQAVWSVALALGLALILTFAVGALIAALTPNVRVVVHATSVLRTGLSALVAGAIASALPLRRVIAVDPATAFRRP